MHYCITEDARGGSWRWYLWEGSQTVAQSLEAFTDTRR